MFPAGAQSVPNFARYAGAKSVRLLASQHCPLADALLAMFDAKYHYNFWRPVVAIRNGDRDGNDGRKRCRPHSVVWSCKS